MKTVEQLLAQSHRLHSISDTASLDTELLLCFCLGKSRSYLRAWPDAQVADLQVVQFDELFTRRERGEPVAYLIGERGFWTLDLNVNRSTLIPRPETELLVEKALALTQKNNARILDLGTGTGAIALALASERPQWNIIACDVEPEAVALAVRNKQENQLKNVEIFQSNWFENIAPQSFDMIVSNPPYIDANDPHLRQGDVSFEPRSALVAANKGLADIEQIIQQSRAFLAKGAWLLFEHGYDQAQAVGDLLTTYQFHDVFCEQDLAGMDRVSGGRLSV